MKLFTTGIVAQFVLFGLASCAGPAPDGEDGDKTNVDPLTTTCGVGTTVAGVDVSYWDDTINWTAVKGAGVDFAYIRVSDGLNTPDTQFAANWSGANAAGLYRGAYQFFEPDQDPTEQAELLLAKTGTVLGPMDLPPAIDVEVTDGVSQATLAANVKTWITYVTTQIGRPPVVYTGSYFWDDNVDAANDTTSPLWHAQYTSASCPTIATPWTSWAIWQYSDTGSVSGIDDQVDMDRWNGTLAELQAFAGAGTPCATVDATNGLVIDNGTACFTGGGPAAYLRQVTGAGYNNNLIWTHTTANATEANFATWSLYFAAGGMYKVEAYTAAAYAQSKKAKYIITGAGGDTTSVVVDQTAADGWQTIGTFQFDAGGNQSVHLGDNTGEPPVDDVQLVFDAVRITPM